MRGVRVAHAACDQKLKKEEEKKKKKKSTRRRIKKAATNERNPLFWKKACEDSMTCWKSRNVFLLSFFLASLSGTDQVRGEKKEGFERREERK